MKNREMLMELKKLQSKSLDAADTERKRANGK